MRADPIPRTRRFGLEKGSPAGPSSTTTVGETVRLKIQAGGIKVNPSARHRPLNSETDPPRSQEETQEDEMEAMRKQLKDKKVTCRYCQGDHFTARCPYKDTLGAALGETDENAPPSGDGGPAEGGLGAAGSGAGGSRYVPPSMRAGARAGPGETMKGPGGGRDDFPTLRVTNLSEDATDQDMWELFGRFANRGRINRCVSFRTRGYESWTADTSPCAARQDLRRQGPRDGPLQRVRIRVVRGQIGRRGGAQEGPRVAVRPLDLAGPVVRPEGAARLSLSTWRLCVDIGSVVPCQLPSFPPLRQVKLEGRPLP